MQTGDLELAIPKLRASSFFPSLLERPRWIDQAPRRGRHGGIRPRSLPRSVENLVKALGSDTGISKSEVSRICAGLDKTARRVRHRPLDHT
jgi:putative transposase